MDPQSILGNSENGSPTRNRTISNHNAHSSPDHASVSSTPSFNNRMNNLLGNRSSSQSNGSPPPRAGTPIVRNAEDFNEQVEDNESTDNEQLLGERNFREGIEHIRMRFDIAREGQTVITFFQNILPFIILFSFKYIVDHFYDIGRILALFCFFLQADHYVQKIFSGGLPNKMVQLLYALFFSSLTISFILWSDLEDFAFTNVFGLNVKYFISGEYASASCLSTIYGIITVDTVFKLITIMPKLAVMLCPDFVIASPKKRRIMQFVEYCSQLYRCALPFGPWVRYFFYGNTSNASFTEVIVFMYFSLKVRELFRYSMSVRRTLRYLFSESSFGTVPSPWEIDDQTCTVCHEDMTQPIQLECKHIFCKMCIEQWLDTKPTCPMCRAVVAKDTDNEWKNGGTSRALRFF